MEFKYKVYRAFREITSPFRNFKTGVKSLIYWFPVIWKNRWYDYEFLLDLIEHQLKLMSNDKNKSYTEGWDECVEEMKLSLRLLDHFNNQSWEDMSLEYDNEQMWIEEFIDSLKVMRKWWD